MLIQTPKRRRTVISLTPLIDVVFILLVFFMLASSFLDWRSYEVSTKVDASASTAPNDSDNYVAKLRIDPEGLWILDGEEKASKIVIRELQDRQAVDAENFLVILTPDPDASVQMAITTLDELQQAGIETVSLRAPKGDQP